MTHDITKYSCYAVYCILITHSSYNWRVCVFIQHTPVFPNTKPLVSTILLCNATLGYIPPTSYSYALSVLASWAHFTWY